MKGGKSFSFLILRFVYMGNGYTLHFQSKDRRDNLQIANKQK